MRILVVGVGRIGTRIIRQLRKNPEITIITLDAREKPKAVKEGVIPRVDIAEPLTPLSLQYVLQEARPDMILLTMTTEDMGLGTAPGLDILTEALWHEIASIAQVPVIEVARTGI